MTKPLDEFYANLGGRDGRRPECKACTALARRQWYEANREREIARVLAWKRDNPDRYDATQDAYRQSGKKRVSDRKSHLKRKYGITLEQYDEMLAAQGGGCAICGRPPRDDISLHVDHCHDSSDVRGLLCFRCNNALGDFDHDERLVRAAADYLAGAMTERARRRATALRPPA
jgi:hypothetical protein